jgi:hypothetical protein
MVGVAALDERGLNWPSAVVDRRYRETEFDA